MAAKKSSRGRKPAIQRHQGHGQHPSFDLPNPVDVAKAVGKYVGDVFSPSTYTKQSKSSRQRQIRATNTAANKVTEKVYSSAGGKVVAGDFWAPTAAGKAKATAETLAWLLPVAKAYKFANKFKAAEGAGMLARAGAKTGRGIVKGLVGTGVAVGYDKATSSAIKRAENAFEKKKPKVGGTRRPAVKKKGK